MLITRGCGPEIYNVDFGWRTPVATMKAAERFGTQTIERTLDILRALAARGRFGWGLGDLAAHCKLSRSTTHRVLACLVRERMATQRASDRHYLPGPMIFELGLAMQPHVQFQAACHAPLARLASALDAQAILYLRSGRDFVCADFAGRSAYVGAALEVGMRRPLAFSAGGAAILVALPAEQAREIIDSNLAQAERMGDAAALRLHRMLRRSRRLGYAFNKGETTKGVHSFGVPLRDLADPSQSAFGALAVSGEAKAFPASRAAHVVAAMRREAEAIEQKARGLFFR